MLKSFYNYLVNNLIIGYFKERQIEPGSRYYFIVENEEHRDGIMQAIVDCGHPIVISEIYQGTTNSIEEESYDTIVLSPASNKPQIIIGYDVTSTEDYLTTIRNAVGVKGGKYENYCVLYILSDAVLSSLITACKDLQSSEGPLYANYIIGRIESEAKQVISKDLELIYLQKHLNYISQNIADGICNLFDFQHALNILADKTLKEHFNELEMFNDKTIYLPSFKTTDADMADRVQNNLDYYRKIRDIMNEDDIDRQKLLERFLDEKLAKKIAYSDDWQQTDLSEILASIDRKAVTAKLELMDIELVGGDLLSPMLINTKGNKKKKTENHIIICDESGEKQQTVKISFNKDIKKYISSSSTTVAGSKLSIKVAETMVKQSVGLNDNHHDFFIERIPCSRSFFHEVGSSFIFKKGRIYITVPEDATTMTFGNGSSITPIPFDGKIDWSSDMKLEVPVVTDNDQETIDFEVNFNGHITKFTLVLYAVKAIPPIGPESFPTSKTLRGVNGSNGMFTKVTDGESERGIFGYWRKFLNWEKCLIDEGCHYINYQYNDLIHSYEPEFVKLELPESISSSITSLYNYFSDAETIPSLCAMSEGLYKLYKNYFEAVWTHITSIPSTRALTKEEYNITKLGTISSDDNKIYLSPFHPILVAYLLEFHKHYDGNSELGYAKKLLSPFYLIPYLYFNDRSMRPYTDSQMSNIWNWLCYEDANSRPQERTNDITTKMVWSKMEAFIKHFSYLFQDKDCPIIISTIGLHDDTNVIKGIIEFIKRQFQYGVQRVELHEYVENLMDESFFERLNRLDSTDNITRELEKQGISLDSKGEYTNQEIIHQLFTRVSLYKHKCSNDTKQIDYCHIAFYQMDTGLNFIKPNTDDSRIELSLNGLISIPSTLNKDDAYVIGFGTKYLHKTEGFIFPMAVAMNNLYANEQNEGSNVYHDHTCVAKRYKFIQSDLLNSIYSQANWVTFINPEVDINFFYKQDLYVVHYTDQYTINAKYDSITVTKHIDQYENMLRKPYETYSLAEERFEHFNETMMDYFNCLNGNWMLSIVNKTESQIREKMSIVAASISMQHFLKRNYGIIWIPISLDEILRVTGSIGLPQDYIFSKKVIGAKGAMSDDLLMMGLDCRDTDRLKLFFYPTEVKFSKNSSMADKGGRQVSQTYTQIKQHLYGEIDFTKEIYRTFFATQYLTNAEKLNANNLLDNDTFAAIEKIRYKLLNLEYEIIDGVPVKEMGKAAVISFYSNASHSLSTSLIDKVPVCEIHFSEKECFQFVSDPECKNLEFLTNDPILMDEDTKYAIEHPASPDQEDSDVEILITQIEDEQENDIVSEPKEGAPTVDVINTSETNRQESDIVHEGEKPASITKPESINIIIGNTISGQRKVIFEPNNPRIVSHPNMGIIGTMGTGKTQLARSIIAQFSKEGIHNVGGKPIGMLIFDYKGDYKDDKFVKLVSGHVYKNRLPFNPLKLIVNEDVVDMNLPAITADRISDSLAKSYGLGLKQQNNIKQTIVQCYSNHGITDDPGTWNNPLPTMNEVIDLYIETYDANDKAFALLSNLRDYNVFTSDNNTCASIFEWLDSVRIIDLTIYSDEAKRVVVSLLLDLFFAEMKQLGESVQEGGFRELRSMILVDEAKEFMSKDFNSLRGIISQGRMFGVGMILATQYINDFKTQKEDYSQSILSWAIHHVNSVSKSEIASIFGASDQNGEKYMDFINKAKLFESVCKIGGKVEGIRDVPFFELIQNDDRFIV